jgi:plastocyanin
MSNFRIRLAGVGAACLLAIVAPACSSDSKSSTPTTAGGGGAASGGAGVTIKNRQYSQSGDLKANTAFTVTNSDGATHTLTDDGGTFSVQISGNGTAPLTVKTPGTYKVHCEIHSSMHGTITVT